MFDLIDESGSDLERFGYSVIKAGKFGATIASLYVDNAKKSRELKLDKGEYYILNCPQIYFKRKAADEASILLFEKLKTLLKPIINKKTLIVGLGNPDIWADCLGKCVTEEIYIDPLDENNHIFKFCPNIFFSTGIGTFDMVAILAAGLKIEGVIVIDSLATRSIERLGKSIQLSSAGMTPGSGVNSLGKRICKESVGVPCFSIGVPFMIYGEDDKTLLAPKDIHENVLIMARIIGDALNMLL